MFQWLFSDTFWFVYEQISCFYCQTFPCFFTFFLNDFQEIALTLQVDRSKYWHDKSLTLIPQISPCINFLGNLCWLMKKQKGRITYTQSTFYFEVKFMEGIMYSCREYLEICIHMKLSGNSLYLNMSKNKDTLDSILIKRIVNRP